MERTVKGLEDTSLAETVYLGLPDSTVVAWQEIFDAAHLPIKALGVGLPYQNEVASLGWNHILHPLGAPAEGLEVFMAPPFPEEVSQNLDPTPAFWTVLIEVGGVK